MVDKNLHYQIKTIIYIRQRIQYIRPNSEETFK